MAPFHDLLSNLAIVALATSLWTFGQRHIPKDPAWLKPMCFGAMMASGTAAVMALPFKFGDGIFLDLRYSFIAIAALYGGPAGSFMCVTAAALIRVSAGGAGLTTGLVLIALAWISGLVAYHLNNRRIPDMSLLLALSAAVAFSGTAGFFVKLPWHQWATVMPTVVVPFAVVLVLATATASTAVAQEMRRQKVTEENRIYRAVIEALPDCLNAKDMDGRFIAANPATAQLMHAPSNEHLIGRTDFDYYAAETAGAFREDEFRLIDEGKPIIVEQKFRRADGLDAWLLTLKSPLRDERGTMIGIVTHNREITQEKLLERELALTQSRLTDAVSSMADGLAMFDVDGTQVFHNPRYLEMFPLTADIRRNGNCLRTIIRAAVERGEEEVSGSAVGGHVERTAHSLLLHGDRQYKLADGRWIEARTRATAEHGHLIVFSDITKSKGTQDELKVLARTDALTGAANRRAFDEELRRALRLPGVQSCLLMLDIDHFKRFNDSYGHLAGDACLRKVAACIAEATASYPGRTVARYGGEEFALILPWCDPVSGEAIGKLVTDRVRALAIEHATSDKGIVTVSIGVAASGAKEQQSELLRRADEALYEAKGAGRDCVRTSMNHNAASGAVIKAPAIGFN